MSDKLKIKVCVVEPSSPFICDAERFLIPWLVDQIEKDLKPDGDIWWPDGACVVECVVTHYSAQIGIHGGVPREELPAYWCIDDVVVLEMAGDEVKP